VTPDDPLSEEALTRRFVDDVLDGEAAGDKGDTLLQQALLGIKLLMRVAAPARDLVARRNEDHAMAFGGEQLCQAASHDVVLIVVDHHRVGQLGAFEGTVGQQVVGTRRQRCEFAHLVCGVVSLEEDVPIIRAVGDAIGPGARIATSCL